MRHCAPRAAAARSPRLPRGRVAAHVYAGPVGERSQLSGHLRDGPSARSRSSPRADSLWGTLPARGLAGTLLTRAANYKSRESAPGHTRREPRGPRKRVPRKIAAYLWSSLGSGGCADPTSIACPIGDAAICINPTVDPKNCGACGTVCVGNYVCDSGHCRCPSGLSECGYQCVNLRSDPANCGGCEVICLSGGPLCNNGECSASCDPGLTQCDSSCVDTAADAANCGDCGKACTAGDTCEQSSCVTQ